MFFFLEQTSLVRICNEQISHAVVTIVDNSESILVDDVAMNLYLPIFNQLKNVTHLDFVIKDDFQHPPLSVDELPSTAFSSSTIVHLSIRLLCIGDCISLLDGRLDHLRTFIVKIYDIFPGRNDLSNTVKKK